MDKLLASLCVLSGLLLTATVSADTIWRWVDSSGQVHFSDVPREGAEAVTLAPASTFSSVPGAARASASGTADDAGTGPLYESLVITSPTQEQTVWNTGGVITVTVSPQPALKAGHGITLYYDGMPLSEQPVRTTRIELSEVFRGEHTLRADIVDASGRVLISSAPVTFFYQQTSIAN